MKTTLYSCLLLLGLWLSTAAANAQAIANLDFETWGTRNGVEAPANWQTTDDLLYELLVQAGFPTFYYTGTVTKSSTAHRGSFAANLTTKATQVTRNPLPGIIILGTRLGYEGLGGAAYTSRPAQLQFYYQLTGPSRDSAAAQILLTSTSNGTPVVVGAAQQYLAGTSSGYALASLPISYNASATPDSVRIFFSSGTAGTVTAGTTLLVDDVSLTGSALAVRADATLQAKLTVSPNPSPGGRFMVASPDQPELAAASFQVFDALGHLVAHQPAQALPTGARELDLSGLRAGVYLLRLDSKQGAIVRQLTVQ